jgi:type I restriction enzyme S subunit
LPLPPLAEQSKIASFLDDQCGRIDELLSEINTQINLLRQYRKSLISEAVTGKIEV